MINIYDPSPDGSRRWERQKRETGPDLNLEDDLRLIRQGRASFLAEGTMPPMPYVANPPPPKWRAVALLIGALCFIAVACATVL